MRDKLLLALCCSSLLATAQDPGRETISKPASKKDQKKRAKKLAKEVESPYAAWENVDVSYIITDEERQAFHRLSTDAERESFIEQFWLRRDPTPDTEENEYKEEHYRRIAYANEHFASGIPGWKTDRGRIYITFGPPDEIDSHPSGGAYQQTPDEGAGQITTLPFERWRYRYLENVGANILIEFVDPSMSGEFHLTIDTTEKNALLHTPMGQQQVSTYAQSFRDEFQPLEMLHNLGKPPAVRYRDLEAVVSTNVRFNTLPLRVRTDYIPITPASVCANVTLQLDTGDLQFAQKDGLDKATVKLYGRVTTLSRHVVSVFEDVISVEGRLTPAAIYQKTLPLAPGRYRLSIAAKDVNGGTTGDYEAVLDVPALPDDRPAASSLILADVIERVPARGIGAGPFIIGDMKVRPRVTAAFHSAEKLGIYLQLYRLERSATIDYSVTRDATGKTVIDYTEPLAALAGSFAQTTIQKWLPLHDLAPGAYTLHMRAADPVNERKITVSAPFTVIQP